jgi:hypothetical protein
MLHCTMLSVARKNSSSRLRNTSELVNVLAVEQLRRQSAPDFSVQLFEVIPPIRSHSTLRHFVLPEHVEFLSSHVYLLKRQLPANAANPHPSGPIPSPVGALRTAQSHPTCTRVATSPVGAS